MMVKRFGRARRRYAHRQADREARCVPLSAPPLFARGAGRSSLPDRLLPVARLTVPSHSSLEHLAHRVARQLLHESRARDAVIHQPLRTPCPHLPLRQTAVRDTAAATISRRWSGGEDRRFAHPVQCVEDLLHHRRVDVMAAGDDQFLASPGVIQVACIVKSAEVAGVEPAAREGLSGGVGAPPILTKQIRPSDQNPADLTRGEVRRPRPRSAPRCPGGLHRRNPQARRRPAAGW